MSKVLSKRAIEGRRWRVQARQKPKLNTVIAKYIEAKHADIHTMCVKFYDEVVKKYPDAQDLTKTGEFQQLLKTTQPETEQAGTTQPETEQAGTTQPETEQAGTTQPETEQVGTTQPETEQAGTTPDILSQAMNNTLCDIAEDEDNNRIEEIINNIVKEFENVEPSLFEGLGLNSEDEFGTLLDMYNIDNSW